MSQFPTADIHSQPPSPSRELSTLEARISSRRDLLQVQLQAFLALFQSAHELVLGNSALVVLDYLVRCEDQHVTSVQAALDAAHQLVERLIGNAPVDAQQLGPSFSPLTGAFNTLAKLVSTEGFPTAPSHGDVAVPDIFRDAATIDLTGLPMGEKQACRKLSRSRSLADAPVSVLAAAGPGLLRLLGIDHVLSRSGSHRDTQEIRDALAMARSTLERIAELQRVLDHHLDALRAVIANQERVGAWMVEGLEALTGRRIDHGDPVASSHLRSLQLTALHHYAVIFELRYQYLHSLKQRRRVDKYRLMHSLRSRTPIAIGIKRIASYFCVAMRYSAGMRGSTRLGTFGD